MAIDTALNACGVAIVEDGAVLGEAAGEGGRGHAERLLPAIERARAAAGLALMDLDGFAVTIGPGSFTGIRTALATARGLALALDKPLWGVTTTQALQRAAAEPSKAVAAVIDARRGEVYLQCFDAAGAAMMRPVIAPLAEAATMLPQGPVLLVGSGGLLLRDAAGRDDLTLSPAPPDPSPRVVAALALEMARRDGPPRHAPLPLYLRAADAALPRTEQPRARLQVAVRAAGAEAAELLAALHAEAFAEGWNAKAMDDLLRMPGARAWLAVQEPDQPAGFALLRMAADEAEIITIAVRPRLQGLQVGRQLLDALLTAAREGGATACFLEVAEDNIAARALYDSAGFREAGRRPGYYARGAGNALILRRDLRA